MKTLLLTFLLSFTLLTPHLEVPKKEIKNTTKEIIKEATDSSNSCGPSYAVLKRGPKGGCYYINKNGNKSYVSRICCD